MSEVGREYVIVLFCAHPTRVVAAQRPNDAWCEVCDEQVTVRQWTWRDTDDHQHTMYHCPVMDVGRDQYGEPTVRLWSWPVVYVIPVTEAEHLELSQALDEDEYKGEVYIDVDQTTIETVKDMQELRQALDEGGDIR
jgi:hypothetical protein